MLGKIIHDSRADGKDLVVVGRRIRPMRIGALVFTMAILTAGNATAQDQGEPAPSGTTGQPSTGSKVGSFFRQLGQSAGHAAAQMGGSAMHLVSNTPNTAIAPTAGGALYTPVAGGHTFQGMFPLSNHDQAKLGRVLWPRAALYFDEYGVHLSCWTITATIWTSATVSTKETFKTCLDAPLAHTDATGQREEVSRLTGFTDLLIATTRYGTPSTGDERTTGPVPPRQLFNVDVDSDLNNRLTNAVENVAWVSGFYGVSDMGHQSLFYDYRLWIAGFNPQGNRH